MILGETTMQDDQLPTNPNKATISAPKRGETVSHKIVGDKLEVKIKQVTKRKPRSFITIKGLADLGEIEVMESYQTVKKRMWTMSKHVEVTLAGLLKRSFHKDQVASFGPLED